MPDLCYDVLYLIVKNVIPLGELPRLRYVSKLWNTAILDRYRGTKTLRIFDLSSAVDEFNKKVQYLKPTDADLYAYPEEYFLVHFWAPPHHTPREGSIAIYSELFPNITTLCFGAAEANVNLTKLLAGFSKLSTLALSIKKFRGTLSLKPLLVPGLKHLYCDFKLGFDPQAVTFSRQTFQKLERFSFFDDPFRPTDEGLTSVATLIERELVHCSNLKHLNIFQDNAQDIGLLKLLPMCSHITSFAFVGHVYSLDPVRNKYSDVYLNGK